MDKYAYFRIWAPHTAQWSPWVKPVLFAHLPVSNAPYDEHAEAPPHCEWLPAVCHGAAVVLDLPGSQSVFVAMELARRCGHRPTPLFTSIPPESAGHAALVPTAALLGALQATTLELDGLNLPQDGLPTFLLDANRHAPHVDEPPLNAFDNRSAVFASDFPSAALLRRHGIGRCVVVRHTAWSSDDDLSYALSPWHDAGLTVEIFDASGTPLPVEWPPTGFWGRLLHRFKLLIRLRAGRRGGFGRLISEASGG